VAITKVPAAGMSSITMRAADRISAASVADTTNMSISATGMADTNMPATGVRSSANMSATTVPGPTMAASPMAMRECKPSG
jgi:hypothetical protein